MSGLFGTIAIRLSRSMILSLKCTSKCVSWERNDELVVNFHLAMERILPFKWRQLVADI